ncbi:MULTISPECIES: sulfatase family protein [unclassified Saccharicrinis]|uniref:sulfatase family protein n=1 Tax=unclassified Saccharicrinis TaxID=2646859 RepID=UPI003D353AFF
MIIPNYRKSNLAILLMGVFILFSACTSKVNKKKHERPNIIFLMDDQHRWDALGVENGEIITPTLDKLAKNGVRFTQAVCQAPMCVPSRNSMMLGLYANQTGVLQNARGIPDDKLPTKPLAQVFQDAGYETVGFGKTHWGVRCNTRGFETRYIAECFEEGAVMMKDLDPDKKQRYLDETIGYGPGEEDPSGYIGETSKLPEGDHRDGWVTEKCLDYIKNRQDERPLFLYLSFLKPHAGHNVPVGFEDNYNLDETVYAEQPPWEKDNSPHAEGVNRRELYEGFWKEASEQQWKEMTMRYYANCTWIDDMFGRAMKALEEKGLLENSIIIYVSDHGEMLGERYYRFNKYCLYDASVRVPIIISGAALPEDWKGKEDARPAELVDIYPTLLKAAGIEVPEKSAGMNLLEKNATRKASFCALHERKDEASFMVRTQNHKLILCFARKEDASTYTEADIVGGEFYDLQKDPKEWNNLYDEKAIEKHRIEMTEIMMGKLGTMSCLVSNAKSEIQSN